MRKDAGELEMQRHRLEGEKEQLEIQLKNADEQLVRSKQWFDSIITDAKEADFQLKDLEVGRNLLKESRKNKRKAQHCSQNNRVSPKEIEFSGNRISEMSQ